MGINVGVKLSSQKTKDKVVKVGVKVGVKKPLFSSDILGVSAVVKVLAPKLPKPFARCEALDYLDIMIHDGIIISKL